MLRYYQILKLKPGASEEQVKRSYREHVKVWHPDRFASDATRLQQKAHEKIQEINEAYAKILEYQLGLTQGKFDAEQPFHSASSGSGTGGFSRPNTRSAYDDPYSSDGSPADSFTETCEAPGFYVRVWPNGDKYEGQVLDGQMHGMGVFSSVSGDVYVGQFKFGRPDGRGKMDFANGDRYQGDFREDSMHGRGTYHYVNGDKFIGHFQEDRPHGHGVLVIADGKVVSGHWEHGALLAEDR